MALRARLTPPRETKTDWPWHKVKSSSLRASQLFGGDRRMEAESFLASGFGTRIAIQGKSRGWRKFSDFAEVWQPTRLKGIIVDREFGEPYLSATQVFDLRPKSRRFLSVDHIADAAALNVVSGQVLVTRSGTVGRATLAQQYHEGHLISDDLLRVVPKDGNKWGWIYSYLRAPSIIAMMQAAHYGHVIKHLEVAHLNDIPIIEVDQEVERVFQGKVTRINEMRDQAETLQLEAERLLSEAFSVDELTGAKTPHAKVRASEVFGHRRRLEASFHSSDVRQLLGKLNEKAIRIDRLSALSERVWWMTRFSRSFGEGGVPYMSADELFSVSQVGGKQVHIDPVPNHRDFFVQEGWILMACSGQIYGLNGSVTMATARDEEFFFSHDLIRIAPGNGVQPGYLFAYLSHPEIGQSLIKRTAYGSSVPHIDPGDVEALPIARLESEHERQIGELAFTSSRLRAEASALEREVGEEADEIVHAFIR